MRLFVLSFFHRAFFFKVRLCYSMYQNSIPFYDRIMFHCMHTPHFVNWPIDEHSNCFHFLAIMNNTQIKDLYPEYIIFKVFWMQVPCKVYDLQIFILFGGWLKLSWECSLKPKFFDVYLFLRERERERERERDSTSGGGAERETESEAGSRLWTVSTEPDTGLELMSSEIMTWAKVGRPPDWST